MSTTAEKAAIAEVLDTYRGIVKWKLNGVSQEDAVRPLVSSGTSLLGIIKHLAYVERWWFHAVLGKRDVDFPWTEQDPDPDWRIEDWESIQETLYLLSVPGMRESIKKGLNTPTDECEGTLDW